MCDNLITFPIARHSSRHLIHRLARRTYIYLIFCSLYLFTAIIRNCIERSREANPAVPNGCLSLPPLPFTASSPSLSLYPDLLLCLSENRGAMSEDGRWHGEGKIMPRWYRGCEIPFAFSARARDFKPRGGCSRLVCIRSRIISRCDALMANSDFSRCALANLTRRRCPLS